MYQISSQSDELCQKYKGGGGRLTPPPPRLRVTIFSRRLLGLIYFSLSGDLYLWMPRCHLIAINPLTIICCFNFQNLLCSYISVHHCLSLPTDISSVSSLCLSCISTHLFIHLSVSLISISSTTNISLNYCTSVQMFVCLPSGICLHHCLLCIAGVRVYKSVCAIVFDVSFFTLLVFHISLLPVCLSVCVSVCLPVCLPVSLSICLSVCSIINFYSFVL